MLINAECPSSSVVLARLCERNGSRADAAVEYFINSAEGAVRCFCRRRMQKKAMNARMAKKAIPPITDPTMTGVEDEEELEELAEAAVLPFALGLAAELDSVAETVMGGPPVSTDSADLTENFGSYICVTQAGKVSFDIDGGSTGIWPLKAY